RSADAIVVLTGGSGRLEYGLQLLAEGKAPVLFVSGAEASVTMGDILRRAPQNVRRQLADHPSSIVLGRAENTIGNAEETAQWLKDHAVSRLILVTSNYHMPRSLLEFSDRLPDTVLIPAPVMPETVDIN